MRIILATFDREPYSSAVKPCLALLRKFWPGFCGWPLSVVWNERIVDFGPDAPLLLTGHDTHWGRMLSSALSQVEDEWVLYLCEDYFALGPWDSARLAHAADAIQSVPMAGYLRLCPCPPPDRALPPGVDFGEHVGGNYRASLQPSFWRREYLMRLCAKYPTPWDFEIQEHGDPDVGHYSYADGARSPVQFTQGLRRGGLWQDEALELCRREGVVCPNPLLAEAARG